MISQKEKSVSGPMPAADRTMKHPRAILSLSAFLLPLAALAASAQPHPWQWAEKLGGDGAGITSSRIAVDDEGNAFVTGAFSGSAEFGSSTVNSVGGTDIYVVKVDPYGEIEWARSAGGSGSDAARSVAVDADGNSYIAGFLQGSAVFDAVTVPGNGGQSAFLAKYTAAGVLEWVRTGGGTGADALGVALDSAGNPCITGLFAGAGSFGALPSLVAAGSSDVFVAAYNAAGVEQWAIRAGGSGFGYQAESGRALAVDGSGDVYIAGHFLNTAHFGSFSLTSSGGQDVFVAKYSPAAGAWEWARKGGGSGVDFGSEVKLDSEGNLYLTGIFAGTAQFGGAMMTAGAGNFWDRAYFVLKYDSAGTLLWAKQAPGVGYFAGHGIAVDAEDSVYLSGTFLGTATIGDTTITSEGYDNVYVAKFNPAGGNEWVVHSQGSMYHVASNLGIDAYGGIYLAGWFLKTAGFGENLLTSVSPNAYVAKMGLAREPAIELLAVRLEIRPGSCTNPVQTKSAGVLPLAVLGMEDFDLSTIDLATVGLWRADGVGGSVAPLRTGFEDVEECGLAADGIPDLIIKFDTAELVEVLELNGLAKGVEVELVISGAAGEGAEFAGADTIVIR